MDVSTVFVTNFKCSPISEEDNVIKELGFDFQLKGNFTFTSIFAVSLTC